MSQEIEFSKWLRREGRTFSENIQFAIKAWQSVDFTLTTKYELVLQWLAEQRDIKSDQILENDFKELLKLRAQPGIITQKVKNDFVTWFLEQSKQNLNNSRMWCNLLHLLVEFELLQDLYRMDYAVQCRVFQELFSRYEEYLLVLEQNGSTFLSTYESEFIASVLKSLKEIIKRCADIELFEKAYAKFTLQPMVQVLLLLRTFGVDFFEDLLEIESILCDEMKDPVLISRIFDLPLPTRLLCLECAILKRKGVESFTQSLLQHIFQDGLKQSFKDMDPSLLLTVAAFVLEMLGRHGVSLNIEMNKKQTAVKFLGENIFVIVKQRTNLNLKEVLMLLCAVLRLNPLILEENVFEITARMILTPKSVNQEEQKFFEDYLILLMDMFRRLSRAEKFVTHLIKAVKEQLKSVDLSAKIKRTHKMDVEYEMSENKRIKLENCNTFEEKNPKFSKYLNILFQGFMKPTLSKVFNNDVKLTASSSFPKLQTFWPSNTVGIAFSKIVTGLVSKPSLTIWKSLLYALKDLIESLNNTIDINENSLFQLDFQTALLSQYFAGCKLAEQSDKFLVEIKQQREFTLEVLKLFGKILLENEHQSRIMSAFMELVYFASSFDLLLVYYRPDGCADESLEPLNVLKQIHSFLTEEEWALLHQRVLNFGKSSCKHLLFRLKVQKLQASALLLAENKECSILNSADSEALNSLPKIPQTKWYLQQLQRKQKENIANYLISKPELLHVANDDLEMLELVSLTVYEEICKSLNSKHSLLTTLSCDFEKLRQCVETTAYEVLIKDIRKIIICRSEDEYMIKKLPVEDIKKSLDLLSRLPLGQLRRQRKTIIFALHMCLYSDLKNAQEEELSKQALEVLKDLLHFGEQILIFKYFPTSLLLKLLPANSCWEFYEFLFSTIKNEEKGTETFLQDLANFIRESQLSAIINGEQRKLLLAAIETLSSLSGPSSKRMRKHLETFLTIFSDYLKLNFITDGTSKKEKKFVQKTLSGFASYASVVLTKAAKSTQTANSSELKDFVIEVDEDFRRISKIYIGHSMDYRNIHAVRLMQVALNHRELLHLDQDEIEFVLTNYWSQINEDLKNDQEEVKSCCKNVDTAVKMIIGHKTNEDFLLVLKTIAYNLEESNYSNILRLLTLVAKCPLSTIKGAIFNEQYKQIIMDITLRLSRDEQQHFKNFDLIVNLLSCHQTVLDNKMIPISIDTMDSILSFLMDINIKKFDLNDNNLKAFHAVHLAMIEVCASFIKVRHILLMDRVPQYMHIFKDLMQAIVWYKSERQKDTTLPSNEIDNLSELALKMEALMHLIAQHRLGVKRVAPFVLTFIINLMVSNKRPTTLYNKVKTHVENICYELVGICDHRVGRFILRCSNEAGRQLYEVLVKDYQKYHKFKGKV